MMHARNIYADYNATCPPYPQALEAAQSVWAQPQNPSSVHQMGAQAKTHLQAARKAILAALHATHHELVFTATGTEANALALSGFEAAHSLLVGAGEHASVLAPALARDAHIVPLLPNGLINIDALEVLLQAHPKALVSIMLANNETGVIQPMEDIAKKIFAYQGFLHVDASQAVGKITVDIDALQADLVTFSAHKAGGFPGAAALVIKKGLALNPLLIGGGQEKGYRAGTENIPAIVAFAAALQQPAAADIVAMRDVCAAGIAAITPEACFYGQEVACLPNTLMVGMPGVLSETQLIHFDLHGVCVSAGSACSSGKISASHVLQAMGIDEHEAKEAIRISFGWQNTVEDAKEIARLWGMLYQTTQHKRKAA